MVGDLDLEATITAVAQTLGALPPRDPKPALEAMRHWRFAPVLKDGKAVEQRAWIRMRFTAQKD